MRYYLISEGDREALTVVHDGDMFQCDSTHPYWDEIREGTLAGDPEVLDLLDMGKAAATRFERVTERVSVDRGIVYFDGDPVDNSLTQAIVRAMQEGADFKGLALFMEKVYQNPNRHSRQSLYTWLADRDFTITSDGNLIAYKGVNPDGTSIHSGPGIVDGVEMNGNLPNAVGSVLEMARSSVAHDPAVGCSVGLHVGTWDYASSFSRGRVLKVIVNPRDVVSVPTDCSWAKMRVCRYKVAEVIEAPVETLLDEESDWDDWDEDGSGNLTMTYARIR